MRGPLIKRLRRAHKVLLCATLVFPKAFILMILLIVGSEFLVYTTTMEDLIIKVLSLQFILLVDRIFFDSLIAHNKKQDIRCTTILQKQDIWLRVSVSWV